MLALAGSIGLLTASVGKPLHLAAFAVYCGTLVLLYSASAAYHALKVGERGTRVLQRIDHTAIFLLIAGTYTPVCLVLLRGAWGWSLMGVVWAIALAGFVFKLRWLSAPRWLSTAIFVVMGWIALVAIVPLTRVVPPGGMVWLVVGGLAYTAGAFIYAREPLEGIRPAFGHHDVFHLCVLTGSAVHFAFMVGYVLPRP